MYQRELTPLPTYTEACERLYEAEHARLLEYVTFTFCYRNPYRIDPQDVTQKTWERAWKYFPTARDPSYQWLCWIARNAYIDLYRYEAKHPTELLPDFASDRGIAEPEDPIGIDDQLLAIDLFAGLSQDEQAVLFLKSTGYATRYGEMNPLLELLGVAVPVKTYPIRLQTRARKHLLEILQTSNRHAIYWKDHEKKEQEKEGVSL
jgi:DNA-directed RNA polymerase specialized sigma24 family protein